MTFPLGATVQALSGLVVVAIAVGLFVRDPGHRSNRAFSLVLVLSGGLLLTASGMIAGADASWARTAAGMHPWFALALPFASAYFASIYPVQRGVLARGRPGPALVLGAAVALVLVHAAVPGLYWDVSRLHEALGDPYSDPAVVKGPFIVFIRLVEITAAIVALLFARAYLASATAARGRTLLLVSVGFFVPAACTCAIVDFYVRVSQDALFRPAGGFPPAVAVLHDLLLSLQILLILALIAMVGWNAAKRGASDAKRGWWLYFAFLVATSASALLIMLVVPEGPGQIQAIYGIWGFWNLVGAGLIAYGMLKAQLFDIDLRIKKGLRQSTIAAAFVGLFFVASEAATSFFSEQIGTYAGIVAAGLLVMAIAPLQRVAERISDAAMPSVKDESEYRTFRKIEVYKSALETAARDGVLTTKDRSVLQALRESLGLSAAVADAVESDVLAALAARHGTAVRG